MASSLEEIAAIYRQRYGNDILDRGGVRALKDKYLQDVIEAESNLIDAVSGAASLQAILWNDHVEWAQTSPLVKEAFGRVLPNEDPVKLINMLNDLPSESRRTLGYINTWVGTLFEMRLRDGLNAGKRIGDLKLDPGQTAVLSQRVNERGVDILINNADGTIAREVQAKAVKMVTPIKEHLEKYPDVPVMTTSEIASSLDDTRVMDSGIQRTDLREQVNSSMEELDDNIVEEIWEHIGLPIAGLIIVVTEGRRYLVGRQTFRQTMEKSANRASKTAVTMGVGFAVAALPGPNLAIPAMALTRVGFRRYNVHTRMSQKLQVSIEQLRGLNVQ